MLSEEGLAKECFYYDTPINSCYGEHAIINNLLCTIRNKILSNNIANQSLTNFS